MVSKYCIPHLKKSTNPHILNISPPLNLEARWFGPHVGYSIAKYGMSLCVLGMGEEFKDLGVGVNALWPRTGIATSAIKMLGGDSSANISRNDDIMGRAAYIILTSESKSTNGNFFIDDEVLASVGETDLKKY